MATQVQWRGGSTAEHATFTGAAREVTVDTQKKTLVVHDGSTVGGVPLMKEDASNSALALGSAGAPSLKFAGDTNTGIYSPGADQVSVATGGTERLRIDAAGQIEAVSLGTAAAPAFSWTGDANTGIYSPGADQVAISTNGTGRLFVDASGRVGVGNSSMSSFTANAGDNLVVGAGSSSEGITVYSGTTGQGSISFADGVTGDEAYRGYIAYNHTADAFQFATAATERLRITSDGKVGVGTTTPATPLHTKGTLRVERSDAATQWLELSMSGAETTFLSKNNATATYGSHLFVAGNNVNNQERARITSSGQLLVGTSSASTTATTLLLQGSADGASGPSYLRLATGTASPGATSTIGQISFTDSGHTTAASIIAIRDGGTWTSGSSQPTRLTFSTTADGASSPTERLRITSTGQVRLAGAGITFNGDTAAANELDDYEEGTHTTSATTTGGSITLSSTVNELAYVKIGKLVTVHGRVTVDSVSSPTGSFTLSLPFTSADLTDSAGRAAGSLNIRLVNTGYDVGLFSSYLDEASANLVIAYGGSTDSTNAAPAIKAGTQIWVSVTYTAV